MSKTKLQKQLIYVRKGVGSGSIGSIYRGCYDYIIKCVSILSVEVNNPNLLKPISLDFTKLYRYDILRKEFVLERMLKAIFMIWEFETHDYEDDEVHRAVAEKLLCNLLGSITIKEDFID